jgi:outer membrane protein OmpA-like peptidoglycan-associated protein
MAYKSALRISFPSQLAVLVLASAVGIPAVAQQSQPSASSQPASTVQSDTTSAPQQPSATTANTPAKEGFWGRVNPFASKKWVRKQTTPINDRLSELDEVNAKNSSDIKDVDARAQAGIRQAQTTADGANQTAAGASTRAQNASGIAQGASGHVDLLNTTVNGLDQYSEVSEQEVKFPHGQPILSPAARQQLDDVATALNGKQGYILEVEAHSPGAGSVGIQNSERLAEAVKRYLVTEHEIPVYRMHAVALGNAHGQADVDSKPIRISSVNVRLMENSLAAQAVPQPQGVASSTGAERP